MLSALCGSLVLTACCLGQGGDGIDLVHQLSSEGKSKLFKTAFRKSGSEGSLAQKNYSENAPGANGPTLAPAGALAMPCVCFGARPWGWRRSAQGQLCPSPCAPSPGRLEHPPSLR